MTNPIQLLRDFRKWRKERYREKLNDVCEDIIAQYNNIYTDGVRFEYFKSGILYGIEHRKEILKQVKI